MKEAGLYPLFSKLLYVKKINIDVNKILKIAKKEKYDVAGTEHSVAEHASQSLNLDVLRKKELSFVKKEIDMHIKEYANKIMRYKNKFQLTTSWFTKTKGIETSDYHRHDNSFLSAVLYIKTSPDTGKIGLVNYNSKNFYPEIMNNNILNSSFYVVTPEDSLLIIFPSDVFHKILPGKGNDVRYSLAMNYFPIGKIGLKHTDSYINIGKVNADT